MSRVLVGRRSGLSNDSDERGGARPQVPRPTAIALALLATLVGCGVSSKGAGSLGNNSSGGSGAGAGTTSGVGSGVAGSASGTSDAGPDSTLGGGPATGSTAASGGAASGSSAATGAPSGSAEGDAQTAEGGAVSISAKAVYTQHNDLGRTGLNPNETILTPANVDMGHFGKKFSQPVDGWVYAQPLYVPGVSIPNMGTHNVVYIATENDSVYAFDGDTKQAALWTVSFLSPGVTAVPAADTGQPNLEPQIGITGTPVIDPVASILYVVAKTKVTAGPTYYYHLHALDLATGTEKLGGPIVISGSVMGKGTDADGGVVTLSSLHELQRPGLALSGGVLYIAFGAHGDHYPYWHGWVLGYDATTLAQKFVYCTTPDADEGSIWQSGSGIAVDPQGSLYVETGNGSFDGDTAGRDLAMSVVKLSPAGALVDWFAPYDAVALSNADVDLGSAGPMILPDQTGPNPHLVIGSGKPGYMYLIDRDQMGHINAAGDTQIVQKVTVHPNTAGNGSGIFATPVYWNGYVYVTAVADVIRAFTLNAGVLSTMPVSQTAQSFVFPGALIAASSNGTTAGILWAVQGDGYTPTHAAVLHAYDATDLTK